MNIFETIGNAAVRIESIHSQFLADALRKSVSEGGAPSLFEGVWKLVAPACWETPSDPEISTEDKLDGNRQIDIVIVSREPARRVVGIEVKTRDGSAEEDQLERYKVGLKEKYDSFSLAMAYLTPFNRKCAGKVAESLKTVRFFEKFQSGFELSKHVSWLEVAKIPWDGNSLWEQHRAYVRDVMATKEVLRPPSPKRNRPLAAFFGEKPVQTLIRFLEEEDIEVGEPGEDIHIDLDQFRDDPSSFASRLCCALGVIVECGDGVSRGSNRKDKFESYHRFRNSPFAEVHDSLFRLAKKNEYVWVGGKKDYALRIAHKNHSGHGVSLIRSVGWDGLRITGTR